MNIPSLKKVIAPLLALSVFFVACQKEDIVTAENAEGSEERATGLVPSDENKVARVDLLVSIQYFKTGKAMPFANKRNTSSTSPTGSEFKTTILSPASLPARHSLEMPPVLNQGSEGSCVSFAVGYAARSAEQFYKTGGGSYSAATNIFSPEYLFNQTKVDDDCSGSTLITALDFLKNNGISTWQSMPYSASNGCATQPSATQKTEAANYRIGTYSMLSAADDAGIKAMLSANHPIIVGATVDNNFYNAKPGFIWKSFSTAYTGHAFVLCGYDDSKKAYKIMNSWGSSWGDAGYSWVDYNFFATLTDVVFVLNV